MEGAQNNLGLQLQSDSSGLKSEIKKYLKYACAVSIGTSIFIGASPFSYLNNFYNIFYVSLFVVLLWRWNSVLDRKFVGLYDFKYKACFIGLLFVATYLSPMIFLGAFAAGAIGILLLATPVGIVILLLIIIFRMKR